MTLREGGLALRAAPVAVALLLAGTAFGASDPAKTVPMDCRYDAVRVLVDADLLATGPDAPGVDHRAWALGLWRSTQAVNDQGIPISDRYFADRDRVPWAIATLLQTYWPDIEAAFEHQAAGGRARVRQWLRGLRPGHWLYPTARAILRERYGETGVAAPFPDVPPNHWAFEAVEKLRNAGILIGYPDGTFGG